MKKLNIAQILGVMTLILGVAPNVCFSMESMGGMVSIGSMVSIGHGGGAAAGGGGTLIKSDSFTEGANTALESHTSESGGGWEELQTSNFDVNAAGDYVSVDTNDATYRSISTVDAPTADYYTEITGKSTNETSGEAFGAGVRMDNVGGTGNGYVFFLRGSGVRESYVRVAGVDTLISSGTVGGFSGATNYKLKISAVGSTISFYIDDVLVDAVPNSAVSTAGRVGIIMRNTGPQITLLNAYTIP